MNSNISDGIKKLEDEINSKLEKTDALKLTDNSKVLNSLVELDKV